MYKLYEDNGGFLHLIVLNSDGNCVYVELLEEG